MIDLAIGAYQHSIVEIDLIDGERCAFNEDGTRCDDEPGFDVDAVEAHYHRTGRLLLLPGVVEALSGIADAADGDKTDGGKHWKSALALWERAREAT